MSIHSSRFALLIVLMAGSFVSARAATSRYTNQDCEYGAKFPAMPTTQIVSTQDGQPFEQAQFLSKEFFLRAECMRMDPSINLTQESIGNIARKFATDQGLRSTEFRYTTTPIGKTAIGRGSKTLSSRPITYEFQCTFGKRSMFCLAAGAPAESFPPEAILDFFKSVGLNVNQTGPNWTFVGKDAKDRRIFVGLGSLVREAGVVRITVLTDLPIAMTTPQGKLGKSLKTSTEFDCQARSIRSVGMQVFSLPMGEGELVGVHEESGTWNLLGPSVSNDALLQKACFSK